MLLELGVTLQRINEIFFFFLVYFLRECAILSQVKVC